MIIVYGGVFFNIYSVFFFKKMVGGMGIEKFVKFEKEKKVKGEKVFKE